MKSRAELWKGKEGRKDVRDKSKDKTAAVKSEVNKRQVIRVSNLSAGLQEEYLKNRILQTENLTIYALFQVSKNIEVKTGKNPEEPKPAKHQIEDSKASTSRSESPETVYFVKDLGGNRCEISNKSESRSDVKLLFSKDSIKHSKNNSKAPKGVNTGSSHVAAKVIEDLDVDFNSGRNSAVEFACLEQLQKQPPCAVSSSSSLEEFGSDSCLHNRYQKCLVVPVLYLRNNQKFSGFRNHQKYSSFEGLLSKKKVKQATASSKSETVVGKSSLEVSLPELEKTKTTEMKKDAAKSSATTGHLISLKVLTYNKVEPLRVEYVRSSSLYPVLRDKTRKSTSETQGQLPQNFWDEIKTVQLKLDEIMKLLETQRSNREATKLASKFQIETAQKKKIITEKVEDLSEEVALMMTNSVTSSTSFFECFPEIEEKPAEEHKIGRSKTESNIFTPVVNKSASLRSLGGKAKHFPAERIKPKAIGEMLVMKPVAPAPDATITKFLEKLSPSESLITMTIGTRDVLKIDEENMKCNSVIVQNVQLDSILTISHEKIENEDSKSLKIVVNEVSRAKIKNPHNLKKDRNQIMALYAKATRENNRKKIMNSSKKEHGDKCLKIKPLTATKVDDFPRMKKTKDEKPIKRKNKESAEALEKNSKKVEVLPSKCYSFSLSQNDGIMIRERNPSLDKVINEIVNFDPDKPDEKAQILKSVWALTKVILYDDGSKKFEILEASASPPGYYMMDNCPFTSHVNR